MKIETKATLWMCMWLIMTACSVLHLSRFISLQDEVVERGYAHYDNGTLIWHEMAEIVQDAE